MNRILEVDAQNLRARVQPGMFNLEFGNALAPLGYQYLPDPASQKAATLGGNVAENSGGPHCFKYGVTTNHVLGLTVVLPDGEIARFGGKAPDVPGYDLTGVFVGSEGTLGICTEIVTKIVRLPEGVKTLLAIYDSIEEGSETVSAIVAAGMVPATLEMMDQLVIKAVEESIKCGLPLDCATVLIIEVDGLKDDLERQAQEIADLCKKHGAREVRVAKNDAERAALWAGRRGAFGAVARITPSYLVCDGTVPRTALPEDPQEGRRGRQEVRPPDPQRLPRRGRQPPSADPLRLARRGAEGAGHEGRHGDPRAVRRDGRDDQRRARRRDREDGRHAPGLQREGDRGAA